MIVAILLVALTIYIYHKNQELDSDNGKYTTEELEDTFLAEEHTAYREVI